MTSVRSSGQEAASTPVGVSEARPETWRPARRFGTGWAIYAPWPDMPEGSMLKVADGIGNERHARLIAAAPELYEALEELIRASYANAFGGARRRLSDALIRGADALHDARGEPTPDQSGSDSTAGADAEGGSEQ